MLAGISAEYVTRLEQGRDRHPSVEVLDALAGALGLDAEERSHLGMLAARGTAAAALDDELDPSVQTLIDSWPLTPAYVHGPRHAVIGANRLAVALSPSFGPGGMPARDLFLDPAVRNLYRDWDAVARKAVALLRSELAAQGGDGEALRDLIDELRSTDERFAELWAENDVRRSSVGATLLRHPIVGDLDLNYQKFAVLGAAGQMLVTYHAEPGSQTEDRLRALADTRHPA